MNQPRNDPKMLFRMPLELRWRDLDAFNHVNNANFMTYIEEARIRWFDSTGPGWFTDTAAPLLAAVQMNYRAPIPYPASIFVEMFAERLGNTSLTIAHRIVDGDGKLYADGNAVLVWIDRAIGRPIPLPASIREAAA